MAKTLDKQKISPKNFLDCGSGTGLLGAAIRKTWPAIKITGMDFSPEMLAQSMIDGSADHTILHNLMDTPWPVENKSYDIVGSAAVINYAADPNAFISNMAAVLKPGGHLVLSYLAGQESTQGLTDDGGRVYLWSRSKLEDCLVESGIDLISNRDTRSYSGRGSHRVDGILMGIKFKTLSD